jgi:uncharacterized protein YcfL
MKKLILFIFSLFLLLSCSNGNEIATVKLSQGDKRATYTKDYIVIEECTGFNCANEPFWKQMEILNNSQNDTIIVILNNNGKK